MLGGPTASGKSSLALALAQQTGAEIVSVDAFQIYRWMDIGTNKPTPEDQKKARHHLLDVIDPLEAFSVAEYLEQAAAVKRDLEARGASSIWVGGTGFYFRALREGITEAPGTPPEMAEELSKIPLEKLVEEAQRVDLLWCRDADLANPRRVQRAVAVYRLTNVPLSEWHARKKAALLPGAKAFYLEVDMEELRELVFQRTQHMILNGWREEVERLLKLPGWETSQSAMALGYREVLAWVREELEREECVLRIAFATGQYAKRQMTWFRKEKEITALPVAEVSQAQLLEKILGEIALK